MNRNSKSLSLRKETLAELTTVQLEHAAGGIIKIQESPVQINDTVWRPQRVFLDPSFGGTRDFPRFTIERFPHVEPRRVPEWRRPHVDLTVARRGEVYRGISFY
jgi:hypothetical protein